MSRYYQGLLVNRLLNLNLNRFRDKLVGLRRIQQQGGNLSNDSFVNLNITSSTNQLRFLSKESNVRKNNSLRSKSTSHSHANVSHKKVEKHLPKNVKNDKKPAKSTLSDGVFKALEVKVDPTKAEENIGAELAGNLEKIDINRILVEFRKNEKIVLLASEAGLNLRMFNDVILSFRKFCLNSGTLPPDLHIKLSDIIQGAANITDLLPFFLRHAYELFPHLNCMEDLRKVSDLTEPSFWYLEARELKRKIIYHSGPTNSGKTYSALQRFMSSKSGIYCGPLKLLANEVYIKANNAGTSCDLLTGEERKFASSTGKPSDHMACTVEMASLEREYDVAIIDEIQMIQDPQRGWAWTRAFLGLRAKEIHVCGDKTATELISDLSFLTGDEFVLNSYERLTPLTIMKTALKSYDNVEPGDCFVCFSKNDLFNVLMNLEKRGHEVALIYGAMPPGVKLAQAARFNDPNDPCKILVATDAIGMGLNLNIRRIIFYSLRKPQMREKKPDDDADEGMDFEHVTTSQALQIAGRAGRFNTAFKDGFVTTFTVDDLSILTHILKQPLEKTFKAGLHPTAEQIELFGYHLPNHSLSELLNIFTNICKIDDGQYFLCNLNSIKFLANLIDHIPIKLKAKYTFATSPINSKQTFVCSCFVKFVRFYSNNDPVSTEVLKKMLDWPPKVPKTVQDVTHLESVYDVLDLYLWLGYRFADIFSSVEDVKQMRVELESVIYEGVKHISIWNQQNKAANKRHVVNRNLHRHTPRYETQNSEQIKFMFNNNNNNTNQDSTEIESPLVETVSRMSRSTLPAMPSLAAKYAPLDQHIEKSPSKNTDYNDDFYNNNNNNNNNKNNNINNSRKSEIKDEIELKSRYENLIEKISRKKHQLKKSISTGNINQKMISNMADSQAKPKALEENNNCMHEAIEHKGKIDSQSTVKNGTNIEREMNEPDVSLKARSKSTSATVMSQQDVKFLQKMKKMIQQKNETKHRTIQTSSSLNDETSREEKRPASNVSNIPNETTINAEFVKKLKNMIDIKARKIVQKNMFKSKK